MKTSILAAAIAVLFASSVEAQLPSAGDPGRSELTRADLEGRLALYEEFLGSPAYSQTVKQTVREDAERVRARLRDGDFRLGDRIVLSVQGEPLLPDTVPVQAGPMITLPLFGDISLAGVLRSEVQGHLTEYLKSFIREPVVRARGLMRVSIQGAVGQPGFYVVPADMLIGEALMAAGGPAPDARLDRLRIERGPEVLAEGDELQQAIREGRTLDQLNLQAGDQIVMPADGGPILANVGLVMGIIGSLSFLIIQLTR